MPLCDFTMARSSVELTGVVTVDVLFAGFESPGVETVAVLVTLGAAGGETATVSVITPALAPPAIGDGFAHVTVAPDGEQLQPAPAADTNVKPDGRTSVIVVVPLVGVTETFATARV